MSEHWLFEGQRLQKLLKESGYSNLCKKYTLRGDFQYRLYWKVECKANGGVGIMVKCQLVKSVMDVKRISPRIYLWIWYFLCLWTPE